MRTKSFNLTVIAILALIAGVLGSQVLGAQSEAEEPIVREELAKQSLGTADGKQARVIRVTLAPGAAFAEEATVTYPAEEFVYVVEGSGTLLKEDEEIQVEAGDLFHNGRSERHSMVNASSDEPLTLLAFWVGDEGDF